VAGEISGGRGHEGPNVSKWRDAGGFSLMIRRRWWIFYFVHRCEGPAWWFRRSPVPGVEPLATRRTPIQVARLELVGTEIRCRRDEAALFAFKAGVDNWGG
jgi:hypothetical protein